MVRALTILAYLVCSLGFSQNQQLFDQATASYNEGEYTKAADNYLKILEGGEHSAELYFNLGNTYYKLNNIAPSIYYYEKALLLKPNDQDIKNNLAYAQNMTLDAIEPLPQTTISKIYKQLTSKLTFDQWAYVAIVFMMLFVCCYIGFYYFKFSTEKRIAFISSFIFLLISIIAVILAYVQYSKFKSDQPAIVFAEEVGIKSEPNNRSQAIFTLHAGSKVHVLEQLNDWKKIQIEDGKTGWLLADDIKELKDF
ncbi:tetratricopeptide repeat protein [Arenibacter sp. TNZ]|jgi:tetratricopeptide (TPR) repeat protein|uniref:SH3 domain-containing protein n=1 Tax=Arenibacter TaxID=178469 RepID=UPI000CD472A5|nr:MULTISPECIES: SH3 domain-containing protein [Arenibacter]MCM4171160.1 tetratricopeptide repeat protein [Arenibacter sp. TNZ]